MEYIVQKESLTEIADAIREKTGGSDLLKFSEIASEIKNISTGVTADTREIYQGTRPLEWIRMPDYDKLDGHCYYVLYNILSYWDNTLEYWFRFAGTLTVEYGSTKDGVFVADTEFGQDVFTSTVASGDVIYKKVFNYADWGKYPLSNGRRQILIRFKFDGQPSRILMPETLKKQVEIKEILCDCDFKEKYYNLYGGTKKCDYHYITKAMTNHGFPSGMPAKYIKREDGCFTGGVNSWYSNNMIKVFNTFKNTKFGEMLRACTNLEEVTIDISEVTSWGNVFRGSCESLRRLTFVGGENLTSFPGDINLNPSSLNVDGVREFFNTLPDITPSGTVRTITLTNSPAATAGIPEDVLSIATNKGWTVTT